MKHMRNLKESWLKVGFKENWSLADMLEKVNLKVH